MDGKDKDKIVMATKPVASRPSNTRLLSVILNNTLNGTPSTSTAEATTATRPKTPSLKPSPLFSSSRAVPSRDDASEPVVIYKSPSRNLYRGPLLLNYQTCQGNFRHKSSADMKTHFQFPASSTSHDNFYQILAWTKPENLQVPCL